MECCLRTVDKQIAAFVAALLSFVAQILSALIIQDTGYFFGIITFSLCCHALLFHGIRKRKMSFMIPYLVCQIVCAAYVLGETFSYAKGLSGDKNIAGCFYSDVDSTRNDPAHYCRSYFWGDCLDFDRYNQSNSNNSLGITLSCDMCKDDFQHYAILVVVSQAAVLVSFVLTWNVVLRYVLFLRAEKIRQRELTPRVSYFNQGMTTADVIPENPPRPENAPPIYTEKAQNLDATALHGEEEREQRSNSLPPYEETPVMITSPSSTINDPIYEQTGRTNETNASYSVAPSVISDHSQYHQPPNNAQRPVTIDDLL